MRLSRPLDWVVISDHSDGMGTIFGVREGNPEMMDDPTLKRWHDMMASGPEGAAKATMELIAAQSNKKLPPAITDPRFAKSYWEKNTAIMEKYNEPAYLRRNAGINRGGYDIPRRSDDAERQEEEIQEEPQVARRQAAVDKPAFLRRIMD